MKKKPFDCQNPNCNKRAIDSTAMTVFRFFPIGKAKSILFCKPCSDRVVRFIRRMVKKK